MFCVCVCVLGDEALKNIRTQTPYFPKLKLLNAFPLTWKYVMKIYMNLKSNLLCLEQ